MHLAYCFSNFVHTYHEAKRLWSLVGQACVADLRQRVWWDIQEEAEELMGASAGVPAAAAAVDEGSSLLSHDEQQEAFFADPTANGAAPGMGLRLTMPTKLAA